MKIIKLCYMESEIPVDFTGKVEFANGTIRYFMNGERHRLNGPSVIYNNDCDTSQEHLFHIHGKLISRNDELKFYNSKEYKVAKQQEDLLNNFKLIKNI